MIFGVQGDFYMPDRMRPGDRTKKKFKWSKMAAESKMAAMLVFVWKTKSYLPIAHITLKINEVHE